MTYSLIPPQLPMRPAQSKPRYTPIYLSLPPHRRETRLAQPRRLRALAASPRSRPLLLSRRLLFSGCLLLLGGGFGVRDALWLSHVFGAQDFGICDGLAFGAEAGGVLGFALEFGFGEAVGGEVFGGLGGEEEVGGWDVGGGGRGFHGWGGRLGVSLWRRKRGCGWWWKLEDWCWNLENCGTKVGSCGGRCEAMRVVDEGFEDVEEGGLYVWLVHRR